MENRPNDTIAIQVNNVDRIGHAHTVHAQAWEDNQPFTLPQGRTP
jgi:hypothetical protein